MTAIDILDRAIAQAKERVHSNAEAARTHLTHGISYRLAVGSAFCMWRTLRRARRQMLPREVGF